MKRKIFRVSQLLLLQLEGLALRTSGTNKYYPLEDVHEVAGERYARDERKSF
jgi:hypothetical protein